MANTAADHNSLKFEEGLEGLSKKVGDLAIEGLSYITANLLLHLLKRMFHVRLSRCSTYLRYT